MIQTRHPATDRSQPPRAGALLSVFRHNWSDSVVGLQKSSGMKRANEQSFEEGTEPLTRSDLVDGVKESVWTKRQADTAS